MGIGSDRGGTSPESLDNELGHNLAPFRLPLNLCSGRLIYVSYIPDEIRSSKHSSTRLLGDRKECSLVRLPDCDLCDRRIRVFFEEALEPGEAAIRLLHISKCVAQIGRNADDGVTGWEFLLRLQLLVPLQNANGM